MRHVSHSQARQELLSTLYNLFDRDIARVGMVISMRRVSEKLSQVLEKFTALPGSNSGLVGYEKKLELFYQSLFAKAKFIAEMPSDNSEWVNVPQTYTWYVEATSLELQEYSDIIGFWDALNQLALTSRESIRQGLEKIRADIEQVEKNNGATCETEALWEFVSAWLQLVDERGVAPPTPRLEVKTTVFPIGGWCTLRVQITSDQAVEYNVNISSPPQDSRVALKGTDDRQGAGSECFSTRVICVKDSSDSIQGELVCAVKGATDEICELNFTLSYGGEAPSEFVKQIEFYHPPEGKIPEVDETAWVSQKTGVALSREDIKKLFKRDDNDIVNDYDNPDIATEAKAKKNPFLFYDKEAVDQIWEMVCAFPGAHVNFPDLIGRVWRQIVKSSNEAKFPYVGRYEVDAAVLSVCSGEQGGALTSIIQPLVSGVQMQEDRIEAVKVLAKLQSNSNIEVDLTTIQRHLRAQEPYVIFESLRKDKIVIRGTGLSYRFSNPLFRWYAVRKSL